MSVSEATVRLYVGGLPADISSKQLEGRFASFGTVSNTKLVPSKQQVTRPGCRGFAYVDFTPKDDQSLHRCLSLYNGCKWLGGVLRVEKAKENYMVRLQREWTAKSGDDEEEAHEADLAQNLSIETEPMRIATPASGFVKRKLLTVKPGPVKRIFAPFKGDKISNLSWDPPPTPPGVRKRRAVEMAAASYVPPPPIQQQPAASQQQDGDTSLPGPPVTAIGTTQEAPKLSHPQDASATGAAEVETQPEASVISSDEGVVDFMTDDESLEMPNLTAADGQHRDTALSRFDDSDDEHMPEAQPLQQTTSIPTAAAPDMSTFDDSDDEQLPRDESQQQAAFTANAASHDLSRLASSETGVAVGAPQPSQTAAAAPELPRRNDSTDEQMQDDSLYQPATAAVAAASSAATQDMSRFDDSDDADEEQTGPVNHMLPYSAEIAHVDILPSPSELASPSASESASEPASETAAAPPLADNAEQLSSASGLSGNASSSAAEDDQAGADSRCDPSENATEPQQPPSRQGLSVKQMQSPEASSESQQDSDAGSQPGSDEEDEQPSADSDGSHAASESQSSEDTSTIPKSNHHDGNLSALADASSNSPDQSQASDSPEQDNADSTDLLQTTAEGRISPQHVDVQGVETQHAQHDEAAQYPDLMSLRVGAGFWRQQHELSEKEWQAQRQVLHADYRAKHRAAVKHTQKVRKPRNC